MQADIPRRKRQTEKTIAIRSRAFPAGDLINRGSDQRLRGRLVPHEAADRYLSLSTLQNHDLSTHLIHDRIRLEQAGQTIRQCLIFHLETDLRKLFQQRRLIREGHARLPFDLRQDLRQRNLLHTQRNPGIILRLG